jgi:predicted nucleic acid-binding protein
MRLYIDSNVIICYIKQELGGLIKAQVIRTKDFLIKCKNERHILIFSDLTFKEIRKIAYYSQEEVEELLKQYDIPFETIHSNQERIRKSKIRGQEMGVHYPDSLHIQLAIDSKADAIVTWNIRDFENAEKLIKICSPTDLVM